MGKQQFDSHKAIRVAYENGYGDEEYSAIDEIAEAAIEDEEKQP